MAAKGFGYSERDLGPNLIRFEGRHPWGIGVTATVVASEGEAAVFDSLMYPHDARCMAASLHQRGLRVKILINSHYHLDHTAGNQFFSGRILAHRLCSRLMKKDLPGATEWAKKNWPDRFGDFHPTPPNETFVRRATVRVGKEHLLAVHTPGHSPDSAVVLVKGARTALTGDAAMEFPLFVDGNSGDFLRSLRVIQKLAADFVLQGHGEVVPRAKLRQDVDYLVRCRDAVRAAGPSRPAQERVQATLLERFVGEQRLKHMPEVMVKAWTKAHLWNLQKISEEIAPVKERK